MQFYYCYYILSFLYIKSRTRLPRSYWRYCVFKLQHEEYDLLYKRNIISRAEKMLPLKIMH